MTNTWHNVYITDKSGKRFFNTTASPMSTMSEIKNLKQHLESAKKHPEHYHFLDIPSAVIVLDDVVYSEPTISPKFDLSDDELCAALSA